MDHLLEKDVSMPVSPMAGYMSSSVISVFVLGVLESEIPIDDSRVMMLLQDVFLPISSRFSSLMIVDKKGKKLWKQVDVSLKEHIKISIFPTTMPQNLYDENVDKYMTKIAMEQLPEDKPLWEMHIIKYPTRNAAGTFIFKLHHALGDGYSFMVTLLSCVQRSMDPSMPVTFPSSRRPVESKMKNQTMVKLKGLPQAVSMVFKSLFDFWQIVSKASLNVDDQTPIRSGHKDVGFRPITISHVSISLDSIKEIKNKLKVSINDAVVGIVFLGIKLYMETMNYESSKTKTTALVLLNTRKLRAYKSVKEMLDVNSEAPWGNRFHFMHVPIPELGETSSLNPLEFVLEANKIIKRKRISLSVPLTSALLRFVNQIKGPKAAATYLYKTLNNSSLSISHMVGPVEQVALANHPIKGLYFMTVGLAQSMTVTVTSYMGYIRVGFGVEKDYIDDQQFKSCFESALEMMLKAARNIATEAK